MTGFDTGVFKQRPGVALQFEGVSTEELAFGIFNVVLTRGGNYSLHRQSKLWKFLTRKLKWPGLHPAHFERALRKLVGAEFEVDLSSSRGKNDPKIDKDSLVLIALRNGEKSLANACQIPVKTSQKSCKKTAKNLQNISQNDSAESHTTQGIQEDSTTGGFTTVQGVKVIRSEAPVASNSSNNYSNTNNSSDIPTSNSSINLSDIPNPLIDGNPS